jgi:predicted ester cyclase
MTMRKYGPFCLLVVVCCGIALLYGAQKGRYSPQEPQASRVQVPNKVQEQNKAVVRQLFEEMFSKGRYELHGQVFAGNCKVHFGNRNIAIQEATAEGKGLRSAAPDLEMAINQISANGDMVTVSWTARGTHTQQGAGLKPSGRKFQVHGRSEFKLANGRIVEAFNEEYRPELFRQLGVSKTQAFMFFAGERVVAALDAFIPDSAYALIH